MVHFPANEVKALLCLAGVAPTSDSVAWPLGAIFPARVPRPLLTVSLLGRLVTPSCVPAPGVPQKVVQVVSCTRASGQGDK